MLFRSGSMDREGVAARVINTPLEFLQDKDGNVPDGTVPRINDAVARLVDRHRGRLHGLATVDAYEGDASARELVRAVKDLGLRGVFIESAKGDLLPDASEARPTFAAAAELGVTRQGLAAMERRLRRAAEGGPTVETGG